METAEAHKEYPDVMPWDVEPHYSRHVAAMTAEGLHSKSDIAIQLAWRDKCIADLEWAIASHAPRCRRCSARTEPERWCYAVPTCFACLPPPPPIEPLVVP